MLRDRDSGYGVPEFPGADDAENSYPLVREQGCIIGTVIRVDGIGDRIPVLVESDGALLSGCRASRDVAKRLAHHLFEPVRLVGRGSWQRDGEGHWNVQRFHIDAFEPVARTRFPKPSLSFGR